jgi:hypothetical protein
MDVGVGIAQHGLRAAEPNEATSHILLLIWLLQPPSESVKSK